MTRERSSRLRLELGGRVECADGAFGKLADVVVDPVARSVTHLVVEPRRGDRSARLVPVALAERGDARSGAIALRLTAEEVRRLPTPDEVAYARLGDFPVDDPVWDVGVQDVLALPYYPARDERADVVRLAATVNPFSGNLEPRPLDVALPYDRIPKGTIEIRRASSVTSADGHELGQVDGFIVDGDDEITHLVLEHGHLWGRREVTIPIGAVAGGGTDAVTLRLTKNEVGALPAVPVQRRPPPPPRSGGPASRAPALRRPHRLVSALLPHPRVAVGRGSANLAGAVYGTIVATAVVLGLEKTSASPARAFWILVGSGVFFWAAHVYSELLAHRLHAHRPMTAADVAGVMRQEWPLFQATFPLAVPLALGALGVIDGDAARDVAAFVGVATLALWGGAIARREGCGVAGVVGAAAANAAVGLSLVALEVALH
jgi:sporulation protein YlmC with PRC-barrel domain